MLEPTISILKAKSFGGDRSAAGRYAAEQRWAREAKVKGYATEDGLLIRDALTKDTVVPIRWQDLDAVKDIDKQGLLELAKLFSAKDAALQKLTSLSDKEKRVMLDHVYQTILDNWKGSSRVNLAFLVRESLIRQGMGMWRDTKGDRWARTQLEAYWSVLREMSPAALKALDAIVKAMYDHTQKVLKDRGVMKVRIFRGTARENAAGISVPLNAVKSYQAAALSSWSLNRDMARQFVGGSYMDAKSVLYDATVPASRIFAMEDLTFSDKTGMSESEVIVVGGTSPITVKAYAGVEKARSFGGDRSAAGRYAASIRWQKEGTGDAKVVFDHYDPHPNPKFPDDFYREQPTMRFKDLTATLPDIQVADAPALADVTKQQLLDLLQGPLMDLIGINPVRNAPDGRPVIDSRDGLIQHMANKIWAKWTQDPNTRLAVLVKDSVSRQFGIPWREGADDRHTKRSKLIGDHEIKGVQEMRTLIPPAHLETFDKIVKGMYEHTQARLAESGLTHVRLFRGTAVPSRDIGKGVYRSSPLAGWTIDKRVADKWEGDWSGNEPKEPVIIEAEIPVKNIFWAQKISRSGGANNFEYEFEFVTLGGNVPVKSMRKRSDWVMRKARSFGGDRSAAGRYAANIRWANHETSADATVSSRSGTVRDPKTTLFGTHHPQVPVMRKWMELNPPSSMPSAKAMTDEELAWLTRWLGPADYSPERLAATIADPELRADLIDTHARTVLQVWKGSPRRLVAVILKDSIARQFGEHWRVGDYGSEDEDLLDGTMPRDENGNFRTDAMKEAYGFGTTDPDLAERAFDKLVMSIYEQTQGGMRQAGFTELRAFRGTSSEVVRADWNEAYQEAFGEGLVPKMLSTTEDRWANSSRKPVVAETLYFGAPASGWTFVRKLADQFEGDPTGPSGQAVVLATTVPAKRVFAIEGFNMGPSSYDEDEIWLIGNAFSVSAGQRADDLSGPEFDAVQGTSDSATIFVFKASFGGNRSEAGRYAANIRWAGHNKKMDSIVERTIANEGLSVRMLTGEEPKTGFMVARRGYTMIVREEDFMDPTKGKAILKKYLKKYGKFLRGEQYLGLWWDKDNNEVVLDVVDQIADRDDAIKAGERENQQYIWDVENAQSIYTGGTGDRETEAPDATGEVSKTSRGHDGRRTGRHGGLNLGALYGGSGWDRDEMRLVAKARLEARLRVAKNQPSSSAVHVDAIMQAPKPRRKKKRKGSKQLQRQDY